MEVGKKAKSGKEGGKRPKKTHLGEPILDVSFRAVLGRKNRLANN